jgi:hypothetical protein
MVLRRPIRCACKRMWMHTPQFWPSAYNGCFCTSTSTLSAKARFVRPHATLRKILRNGRKWTPSPWTPLHTRCPWTPPPPRLPLPPAPHALRAPRINFPHLVINRTRCPTAQTFSPLSHRTMSSPSDDLPQRIAQLQVCVGQGLGRAWVCTCPKIGDKRGLASMKVSIAVVVGVGRELLC